MSYSLIILSWWCGEPTFLNQKRHQERQTKQSKAKQNKPYTDKVWLTFHLFERCESSGAVWRSRWPSWAPQQQQQSNSVSFCFCLFMFYLFLFTDCGNNNKHSLQFLFLFFFFFFLLVCLCSIRFCSLTRTTQSHFRQELTAPRTCGRYGQSREATDITVFYVCHLHRKRAISYFLFFFVSTPPPPTTSSLPSQHPLPSPPPHHLTSLFGVRKRETPLKMAAAN